MSQTVEPVIPDSNLLGNLISDRFRGGVFMTDDGCGEARNAETRQGKEGADREAREKRAASIHALIDRMNRDGASSDDRPRSELASGVREAHDVPLISDDSGGVRSTPAKPDFRAFTEPRRRGPPRSAP